MNILANLRNRVSGVVAGIVFGAFTMICGAILAFVISPQQAVEWRRINNLPEIGPDNYNSIGAGEAIAVTGRLEGNSTLTDDGLVAYVRERWDVDPPDSDSTDEPDGSWTTVEQVFPDLRIVLQGGGSSLPIATVPASSATIGGNLHETLEQGPGPETADYNNQPLPEGSIRTRGFRDGDLITVVGTKATTGDIAPDRLYGGDRTQLVAEIRSAARAAFAFGVGMMICGPILALVIGLGSLFGRNRAAGKIKIG